MILLIAGGARHFVLPSVARGAPRPQARERRLLRETGHGTWSVSLMVDRRNVWPLSSKCLTTCATGEADRLWLLEQVRPGPKVGDFVRLAGLLGARDPPRRLVRRTSRRHLVSRRHPLHARLRPTALSGTPSSSEHGPVIQTTSSVSSAGIERMNRKQMISLIVN